MGRTGGGIVPRRMWSGLALLMLLVLFATRSVAALPQSTPPPVPQAVPQGSGPSPVAIAKPPVPEGCTAPAERSGRHAPPPYPQLAKLMGWEGSTDLQFIVEADGHVRPTGIAIARSSGIPVLDGAALTFLMEYRFTPGNCLGVAREMPHIYRVTFRLEEWSPHCVKPRLADGEPARATWPADVPGYSEDAWVDVVFVVDDQGRADPAQMAILTPSGNRRLDFAAIEYINARRFEPMRCEDTAASGQLGYRVKFEARH